MDNLNKGSLMNSPSNPSNHKENSMQPMQTLNNTKNSNSKPLIRPMTKQIKIETNNNKIRNSNYNVQSFTNKEKESSRGDSLPALATHYRETNNIDSDDDENNNKGKRTPELLEYPKDNPNTTSDNDEDSKEHKGKKEEKEAEYPPLIQIQVIKSDSNSDSVSSTSSLR